MIKNILATMKQQNYFLSAVSNTDSQIGGHSEPIVTGLLIGAKKCREARGSFFV